MPPSPPSLPPPRSLGAAVPDRLLLLGRPDGVTDEPPAPRPVPVLIVERDPAMRAMLTGMLAGPYDVEAVGDNLEAGRAVERRRPDLVIVDLYLREPDGLIFVRALRADPATAELPVILLSAGADPASRTEDRSPNVAHRLFKPFGMRELLASVRSALTRSAVLP